MRLAETVTFGSSGLDRAAHLRGDAEALERLASQVETGILPLWRGKPLLVGTGETEAPGWLPAGSLALPPSLPRVFLGLDEGAPRFAVDMSDWEPVETPETLGTFHDPSEQRHPALPPDHRFVELRGAMTRLSARHAELAATARGVLGWHRTHGHCARCGAASRIANGGWRRDCPACGAQHFPRTDPVAIMLVTHGNSVLLGRAPGWPEGMFSLLAGFIEPGETVEAAVRRETYEETGIRVGPVTYLASQPWPFPASLMIGCHGEAMDEAITIDPAEIEAARWVSREDMMDVVAGTHPEITGARPGAIAHFLLTNWLADTLD